MDLGEEEPHDPLFDDVEVQVAPLLGEEPEGFGDGILVAALDPIHLGAGRPGEDPRGEACPTPGAVARFEQASDGPDVVEELEPLLTHQLFENLQGLLHCRASIFGAGPSTGQLTIIQRQHGAGR